MRPPDPAIEDRASALDRRWFAKHPKRSYRLRPILSGELGTDTSTHVLVRQIVRGMRVRLPMWFANNNLPSNTDEQLRLLHDCIEAGRPAYIVNGRVAMREVS